MRLLHVTSQQRVRGREVRQFARHVAMHLCLICKTITRRPLCEYCARKIKPNRETVLRQEFRPVTQSLFAWREAGPNAVPWMVRSLKGHVAREKWSCLALLMIQTFGPPDVRVLVPVPSPHALGLARALGHWANIPVEDVLIPTPASSKQKRLGRLARQDIEFLRREDALCTKYTSVLICDDVITTGATARAAFRALGQPVKTKVWCLADRRPCGKRASLL